MSREYSEVSYTLKQLIVAAYDIEAGTYGTPELIEDG